MTRKQLIGRVNYWRKKAYAEGLCAPSDDNAYSVYRKYLRDLLEFEDGKNEVLKIKQTKLL